MKLLNKILNKVSSKNFNNLYKATGALSIIASSMSKDEDILNSFYVLAFDEVPNKKLTLSENVDRISCKNPLNLVEKQLIAKEVVKNLKEANKFFDSELTDLVEKQANFSKPEKYDIIKSAKYGLIAQIDGKFHLINPLTNNVTAEYVKNASDINFAQLHQLLGDYRKSDKVKDVTEIDNDLVVLTNKDTSAELKGKIEELGYSVELINETPNEPEETAVYALRIHDSLKPKSSLKEEITTTSAKEGFAEEHKSVTPVEGTNLSVIYANMLKPEEGNIGEVVGRYFVVDTDENNTQVFIAKADVVANKDGYALQEFEVENKAKQFCNVSDDELADAYNVLQKKFNDSNSKSEQDLSGLIVEKMDATNTNLEKDNPELGEPTHEPVEKTTSEEQNISKKADGYDDYIANGGDLSIDELEKSTIKDYVVYNESRDKESVLSDFKEAAEYANKKDNSSTENFWDNYYSKAEELIMKRFPGTLVSLDDCLDTNNLREDFYSIGEKALGVQDVNDENKVEVENISDKKEVKTESSLKPSLFVIDASEEGNIKVYADNKLVNTCKDVKSALEEPKLNKQADQELSTFDMKEEKKGQEQIEGEKDQISTPIPEEDNEYHVEIYTKLNPDDNPEGFDAERYDHDYFKTLEEAREWANKNTADGKHYYEISLNDEIVESSEKDINKKADQELKQFDMKQELDGQKEFEKQDDFSQVSVPEEDTSEVNEAMNAKPEETKRESFSASEFGKNLAYIKQNRPEDFNKIMMDLEQILVGDEQKIMNFLKLWSEKNFQDFTSTTREDPAYARHSQYQEQLKNNVLPKLKEMESYKAAMEEKVKAEKGEVEATCSFSISKKAEDVDTNKIIDSIVGNNENDLDNYDVKEDSISGTYIDYSNDIESKVVIQIDADFGKLTPGTKGISMYKAPSDIDFKGTAPEYEDLKITKLTLTEIDGNEVNVKIPNSASLFKDISDIYINTFKYDK